MQGFDKLFAWLGSNNLKPAGASIGIFYDDPGHVSSEKLQSESCVVVSADVMGSGDVTVKEIGGFEAATVEYRGEANVSKAYDEIYAWLSALGYRDSGAPIETYLSRPGEELHAEIAVPVTKMIKPTRAAKKKPARAKKTTAKKTTRKRTTKSKRAAKKR